MADTALLGTAPASAEIASSLRLIFKRFAPYLRSNKLVYTAALTTTAIYTLLGLFEMYTIMIGISYVVVGNIVAIGATCLQLIAIALSLSVVRLINTAATVRINQRMTVAIRRDLLSRLHRLSLATNSEQINGAWMSKVLFEADRFRDFLTSRLLAVLHSVVWFVAVSVFLLTLSPTVALPTLATLPLMAYIAIRRVRDMSGEWRRQREAWDGVVGWLTQRLDGMPDIRAFGREAAVLAEFDQLSEEYRKVHTGLALRRVSLLVYLDFCVYIALGLLIFFGGLQIEHSGSFGNALFFRFAAGLMPMNWGLLGANTMMAAMGMASGAALTAGTLAAFVLFTKRMLNPIRDISHQLGEITDLKVSTKRMLDILDLAPESADGVRIEQVTGHIEFEDVTFSYTPGTPVLHDISLEVRPGEHLAIVGRTGAGKSSLVHLLVRYYEPDSGTIRLDDLDLSTIASSSVRANVIVVAQEAQLFAGSVMENIRFARTEATDDEVVEAARAVGADDVIAGLPKGYDTSVGDRGRRLSVGERQLVALARAMLADRRIVVLDEAVSSVDPVRQRAVLAATRKLLAGRTAIIVAHWLDLVREADRVIVLEAGRIVENDTPANLLASSGRFADLWTTQNRPSASARRSTGNG
ncbi:MAG TPA: ABC transporter ATP-binding protein [Streptosporangiaceae bacterium]|nr:ABC transporter ATP-binding protein [Streptosporangiaceae bacterium]